MLKNGSQKMDFNSLPFKKIILLIYYLFGSLILDFFFFL